MTLPPQPTLTVAHAPSKLPPPPLVREPRRGSSGSGLTCRAGFVGSTVRGASREPESDFSSLPIVPPVLPDCANAVLRPIATMDNMQNTMILIRLRMGCCMINWLPINWVEI
jgi:hypothetical protein